jgi:hypothetical protein
VASNFTRMCWRPEGKMGTSARDEWLSPWQSSGDHRTCIPWFTAMWASAKARGAQWWAINGGEVYPGRTTSKWVRWISSAPEPELIRCQDFYYVVVIPSPASTNRGDDVNHGVKITDGEGDASAIYFSHCIITVFFSQPDSRCLGQVFSQFSMATQPMLCSKVVALQTIFTFAIASLVKFPLDHDWIRALSSCNFTVSLNSDSKQSDSPSLGLFISKFLM